MRYNKERALSAIVEAQRLILLPAGEMDAVKLNNELVDALKIVVEQIDLKVQELEEQEA